MIQYHKDDNVDTIQMTAHNASAARGDHIEFYHSALTLFVNKHASNVNAQS